MDYGFQFKAGGKCIDKMLFADDLVNICAPVSFWISGRQTRTQRLLDSEWEPLERREGDLLRLDMTAAEVFQVVCSVLHTTSSR